MPGAVETPVTRDWPVPPGEPVLLFGGTFDPPHRAHTGLPFAVRDALPAADRRWVAFVPAARSPHKTGAPGASPEERCDMLALALAGRERAFVWTEELDRAGAAEGPPSYWVDTLAVAKAAAGAGGADADLRFLIGADQAASFHRWHRAEEIVRLAEPVVMLRPPVRTRDDLAGALRLAGAWSADEIDRWLGRVVDVELIDQSATAVRAAAGAGSDDALHPAVARYIAERGLYRGA